MKLFSKIKKNKNLFFSSFLFNTESSWTTIQDPFSIKEEVIIFCSTSSKVSPRTIGRLPPKYSRPYGCVFDFKHGIVRMML